MGRFPFLTRLTAFLKEIRPYYALVSHGNMSRKLTQIHRMLQELKKDDPTLSTNPEVIGEREVGALLEYMKGRTKHREKPMSVSTQVCLIGNLSVFLEYCGNATVSRMRAKRLLRLQNYSAGPLPSPSEGEIEDVVRKLESLASAGDTKALGVLGLVLFGAMAGLRPKEARLADYKDLNTYDWTLMVMHPKGEETWGRRRRAKVISVGRSAIERFLLMRRAELAKRGISDGGDLPLVPCFRADGTISHWSSTYALQVKDKLEDSLKLSFGFQMERRGFGQTSLDRDTRWDSVSVALGHKTTQTTELSYARRKEQHAFEDLEKAWSAPRNSIPAN
jgi:integrase